MLLFSKFFSVFGQTKDKEIISFLNSYKKFDTSKKGEAGTVAHCLPNRFAYYGIITHPFEIATNLPDSLLTIEQHKNRVPYDFNKAKEAQSQYQDFFITMTDEKGQEIDILQQHLQKAEWRNRQNWIEANWSKICSDYGITFNEKTTLDSIWAFFSKSGIPFNLDFPTEGVLTQSIFRLVCETISMDSRYDKVYVYQTPPHAITDNDTLLFMNTVDAIKYFEKTGFKGYLCAPDKSFVLYTDHDLQYSLWGSDNALAEKLKQRIEILPTRLDRKLD